MLVLSRYKDQSIYIGDDIVVTIIDIRGDRIRLGVEAPSHVAVHREEVYEAIQRENALSGSPRIRNSPLRNARDDLDKFGYSEEIRAVRSHFHDATAVVIGGWISDSICRRLETTLNLRLELCEIGYSRDQLGVYLDRPDVKLFIVQTIRNGGSWRFKREVLASGKSFVSYESSIFTAEKIAKAICEQVLGLKAALERKDVEPAPKAIRRPFSASVVKEARDRVSYSKPSARVGADEEIRMNGSEVRMN